MGNLLIYSAALPMPGMPGVLVGFIHHLEARGGESLGQLFRDEIAPCHGVRIAGARPAGQCRPRPRKRDIRVKPDKDRRLRTQCPACEWPNCKAPATHRAPKGAAARARILAVLPRSCPRVQPYVQFLRRHERRGHCPVSEGSRHRPSSDLEDGDEPRTADVALPFLPPSSRIRRCR
jgi:hypothetical protein